MSHALRSISAERIASELMRALAGDSPSKVQPLISSGSLAYLGLHPHDITQLDYIENISALRLAVLALLTQSDAADLAVALRLSNALKRQSAEIRRILHAPMPDSPYAIKSTLCKLDAELWIPTLRAREILHGDDTRAVELASEILQSGEPYTLDMLCITGEDLLALGIRDGKRIGEMLSWLLDQVMRDPTRNKPKILREMAKERTTSLPLS
jgi:tRNA nucleotidyltransferase (CCA-adding enzyme)